MIAFGPAQRKEAFARSSTDYNRDQRDEFRLRRNSKAHHPSRRGEAGNDEPQTDRAQAQQSAERHKPEEIRSDAPSEEARGRRGDGLAGVGDG